MKLREDMLLEKLGEVTSSTTTSNILSDVDNDVVVDLTCTHSPAQERRLRETMEQQVVDQTETYKKN